MLIRLDNPINPTARQGGLLYVCVYVWVWIYVPESISETLKKTRLPNYFSETSVYAFFMSLLFCS